MIKFRVFHLLKVLTEFDTSRLPLDVFLSKYFRAHKSVGSKDRKEICENIYKLIRWKGLIDHFCEKPITWEKRLLVSKEISFETALEDPSIPDHVKVSFPKDFYEIVSKPFGKEKTQNYCLTSNTQAPVTVRANPLKTSREELIELWKDKFKIRPTKHSSHGITFDKKINFFELEEFKSGYFEVQDEGSQVVASYIQAKPGDHVLDFCAGSGGKTLAFAPQMCEKGLIYLYDIRPQALTQARKRLKRAGVQNVEFLDRKKLKRKGLLKKMDWILLDVPCSGTGTLRRNPDMKWRFDPLMIQRLVEEQRKIFASTLKYLAPGGKIVYITCSVLPEENQKQINFFINEYGLKLNRVPFFTFPQKNGMDGFYAAVLSK